MTIPSTLPLWATEDQVDPITNQDNVVEPTEAYKASGWNFKDIPPRQYFNWLFRKINEWFTYIKNDIVTDSEATVSLGGVQGTVTGTLRWVTLGSTIIVKIPRLYSGDPINGVKDVYIKDIPTALQIKQSEAADGYYSCIIPVQQGTTVSWATIFPAHCVSDFEVDKWAVYFEGKNASWPANTARTIKPVTVAMFRYPL